jgi:hypothetical protein
MSVQEDADDIVQLRYVGAFGRHLLFASDVSGHFVKDVSGVSEIGFPELSVLRFGFFFARIVPRLYEGFHLIRVAISILVQVADDMRPFIP